MTVRSSDEPRISTEAADWLFRLEGTSTPDTGEEFVAWLKRSPRHMGEFLLSTATLNTLRLADSVQLADVLRELEAGGDSHSNIVALAGTKASQVRPHRRGMSALRWAGLAASVVCAGVMGLFWALRAGDAGVYATRFGEQRSFKLEDGSVLNLNTDSRARVIYSRSARDVQLLKGEALFAVAAEKGRPFRVHAGALVVQAVGTQFNVYRKPDNTTVSVIEGRVNISVDEDSSASGSPGKHGATVPADSLRSVASSTPGESRNPTGTSLGAGEEARLDANGEINVQNRANLVLATAWRQRRLVFEGTPLSEVVSEFNRYNRGLIRVDSADASALQITGVFNADEPQALLAWLRQDPALEVAREAKQIVIHSRGAAENAAPFRRRVEQSK